MLPMHVNALVANSMANSMASGMGNDMRNDMVKRFFDGGCDYE